MRDVDADEAEASRRGQTSDSDSANENRAPKVERVKAVETMTIEGAGSAGGGDLGALTPARDGGDDGASIGRVRESEGTSAVTGGGSIADETRREATGGATVAFFDLDHTIIDVNSSWLWVKSEINAGRVGVGLVGTALYWFSRYALGYGDGAETAGRDAASLYKGETEESFRHRIEDFFRMELANRMRPGFKTILEEHRARGERCVMCTSTWQHPAEIGAEIFGLETGRENVVSSFMGVDENGCMDGTIQVVAYGDGKYETTKKWCEDNGIDLRDCYFYTDSMSDVKLLENVGHPVCVNPDARLKKHAKEKGWTTVDWGKSEEVKRKPRYTVGCLTCSA